MPAPPTIDDVRAAAGRIAGVVHRTPVATCRALDDELGARVWFKCENLQKVGAFKARGACNAVARLAADEAVRGVVTHSSGNHGAALAWAAATRGIPCTVVMPDDAPRIKIDAVRGYGARQVFCPQADREEVCERVLAETGGTLVHPFEHPDVVAGQGTAALELLEQTAETGGLDVVVAPVGGGGLLAGTVIVTGALSPAAVVWAAEPRAVDDAARSLSTGVRQPAVRPAASCADGLLTGLGALAFDVLRDAGVDAVTVDEPEIVDATWTLISRLKLVVEPSAAVAWAALRRRRDELRGRRIGVILSGGNTDFRWLDALAH